MDKAYTDYGQRTVPLLIAAVASMVLDYFFVIAANYGLFYLVADVNYHWQSTIWHIASLLALTAAGSSALIIPAVRRVPHILPITFFAAAEAYWLSYYIETSLAQTVNAWILLAVRFMLLIVCYLGADFVFNERPVQFGTRVLAAITIVISTMIVGYAWLGSAYNF
jgi:hypothetical protein